MNILFIGYSFNVIFFFNIKKKKTNKHGRSNTIISLTLLCHKMKESIKIVVDSISFCFSNNSVFRLCYVVVIIKKKKRGVSHE